MPQAISNPKKSGSHVNKAKMQEDETIFIPMSDLLTGFLFIFVIMILAFMSMVNNNVSEVDHADDDLEEILENLKSELGKQKVKVEIDKENGLVRLHASDLFEKGQYKISSNGKVALALIAGQLVKVLECYTNSGNDCVDPDKGKIGLLLVEGHTDPDQISTGKISDNWDLSVFRATETYRTITDAAPDITNYFNSVGHPVMGVSGYAATRPVPGNENKNEDEKKQNRRIDLRFIMEVKK